MSRREASVQRSGQLAGWLVACELAAAGMTARLQAAVDLVTSHLGDTGSSPGRVFRLLPVQVVPGGEVFRG